MFKKATTIIYRYSLLTALSTCLCPTISMIATVPGTQHSVEVVMRVPAELWLFDHNRAMLAYALDQHKPISFPPPFDKTTIKKLVSFTTPNAYTQVKHQLLAARINELDKLLSNEIQDVINTSGPMELQKIWRTTPFTQNYSLDIDGLDFSGSSDVLRVDLSGSTMPPFYEATLLSYAQRLSTESTTSRFFAKQLYILPRALLQIIRNGDSELINIFTTYIYQHLSDSLKERLDTAMLAMIDHHYARKPNSIPTENLSLVTFIKKMDFSFGRLSTYHANLSGITQLEELNVSWNKPLDTTVFSTLVGNTPNLKILNLSHCGLSNLPDGVLSLANLEQLDISSNPDLTPQAVSDLMLNMPQLKKLNFSRCDLTILPDKLLEAPEITPSLEHINLAHNRQLTARDMIGVCADFPNLKILDLSRCNLTFNSMPGASGLKKLESLILADNTNLNPNILNFPHNTLPSLKSLDLSNCGIKKLPSSFRDDAPLEELHVSGNEQLNIQSINKIASKLTNLKKLDIATCNIQELPAEIQLLDTIEDLNLEFNETLDRTTLKNTLKKLKKLKKLNIAVCNLQSQPEEVNELEYLETFEISGNATIDVDSLISDDAVTPIKTLDLRYCNISGNHPKIIKLRRKGIKVLI